jgi:hypothetical protein
MEFGLYKTKHTDDEPRLCQGSVDDAPCNREIHNGGEVWLDTENSHILCDACGRCLRYERKKVQMREKLGLGEAPLIKGLDY